MTKLQTPELLAKIEQRSERIHQQALEATEIAREALIQLREWVALYREHGELFDSYLDEVTNAKNMVEVMGLTITVCEKRRALSERISCEGKQ